MPPRLLIVDNYDSFTWNLVQYLGALGADLDVRPNDDPALHDVVRSGMDGVVISPGPGAPAEAGCSVALVRALAGRVPVLGVCLGHQAIGVAFGARVVRASRPMHGKCSTVRHDGRGVFAGLPPTLQAMRYHSLLLDPDLPPVLERSAWTDAGEVMGVRHRTHDVEGVQFHPESIGTPDGLRLLAAFLGRVRAGAARSAA